MNIRHLWFPLAVLFVLLSASAQAAPTSATDEPPCKATLVDAGSWEEVGVGLACAISCEDIIGPEAAYCGLSERLQNILPELPADPWPVHVEDVCRSHHTTVATADFCIGKTVENPTYGPFPALKAICWTSVAGVIHCNDGNVEWRIVILLW